MWAILVRLGAHFRVGNKNKPPRSSILDTFTGLDGDVTQHRVRGSATGEKYCVVTLKAKMAISSKLVRSLFRMPKTNALQGNAGTKDIWSGKAQRALKRKIVR
jgi:hypothetical protein